MIARVLGQSMECFLRPESLIIIVRVEDKSMARSQVVTVTAYAKIATSISINVNPPSGIVPFQVAVTGNLVDNAGVGLQGKSINLYVNGTLTGTQITGSQGSYIFNVSITVAGTFQCQTEFLGDDTYEGCTVHDGTHAMVTEAFPWWIVGLFAVGVVLGVAVSR